jgi:2-keto-3-deoxy-L-rhamnonate aldolase RhmA
MPSKPTQLSDPVALATEAATPAGNGTDGTPGRLAALAPVTPAAAERAVVHRSVGADGKDGAADSRDGQADLFATRDGRPRVLRGVTIYSGSARLAELAARIGFEAVWIEMEHGPTDFAQAETICMAVEASGGVPTLRVPDGQRHHVLRALEVGAQVVVVPMVNDADHARLVVEYGKFAPQGARGFNVRSRGVNYGLGQRDALFAEANRRTHLFAQIETLEAVENLDAICGVDGLSGIFIGPGDLSVSMGMTGAFDGPQMIELVTDCVRRARAAAKHAGILVPPGRMLDAALAAGCDLVFYGGDVSDLSIAWPALLASVPLRPPVARSP